MAIENIGQLKHISGALLSGKKVNVFTDKNAAELYPELAKEQKRGMIAILPLSEFFKTYAIESNIPAVVIDERLFVSNSTVPQVAPVLYLRPRTICAGIGCKRNMEQKPIEEALLQTLKEEGIHPLSLKCIATIPLKSDEPGIIGTAANLNVPLQIIPTEEIENLDISQLGIQTSEFVASQTGVLSVSTACSYLASSKGTILRDKAKYKGITIALSKERS